MADMSDKTPKEPFERKIMRQRLDDDLSTSPGLTTATKVGESWAMVTRPDRFSILKNEKTTGINRHSNKRWYRWHNVAAYSVSTRAHAHSATRQVNLYAYERPTPKMPGRFANVTADADIRIPRILIGSDYDDFMDALNEIVGTFRNREINRIADFMYCAYPILEHLPNVGFVEEETGLTPQWISQFATGSRSWNVGNQPYPYRYPVFQPTSDMFHIGSLNRTALRATTAMDYATSLFGKKLYRKDLVRATMLTTHYHADLLASLRHDVPIDWLIETMRAAGERFETDAVITPSLPNMYDLCRPNAQETKRITESLRSIFARTTPTTTRTLLKDLPIVHDFERHDRQVIRDSARMIEQLAGAEHPLNRDIFRASTWAELHERLVLEYRNLRDAKKIIPQGERHKKIDGVTTESGLVVRTAKDTHEVAHWGNKMRNCIGGYARYAAAGDVILAAVYTPDEELLANMEISVDGQVRQLLGYSNHSIGEARVTEIMDTLKKHKAIKTNQGAPDWS